MSGTDNWYKAGLEEYNRRTQADRILLDFLHSKSQQFSLESRTSCISIGPGTGDVDVPLLTSHCPLMTSYVGVEPNQDEAQVLQDRLNIGIHNTTLKIHIVEDQIESWSGPESPADFILMAHVLYHIPDPQALYRRCVDWLAPGGIMVIVHGGQNIFLPVAEKFDVKDELYRAKHIFQDLLDIGLQNVQQEATYVEFDIKDRNVHLMNFLLQKQADNNELAALDTFLTEIMPSGIEQQDAWVIWWNKPK